MYKKMVLSLVPDNLKKQLAEEKGTVGEGVKYVLLGSLVAGIINGIVILLYALMGGDAASALFLVLAYVIAVPIISVIFSFIGNGIMYFIAKALGGNGTFGNQHYHFSVTGSGVSIVASLVSWIPCIGGVIGLVLGLYYFYVTYLIYRAVHNLSSGKAIVLTVLPIVVLIVLAIVFAAIFGALFLSAMQSLGSTY